MILDETEPAAGIAVSAWQGFAEGFDEANQLDLRFQI